MGKRLPDAIGASVAAHYGYALSDATGRARTIDQAAPERWKVCFQKRGELPNSVILGVVRTEETCPARWIDET
ncbi:hypothetical protein ABZV31_17695 [Streptomyces sp. NPDC005202]|uniref:hypothetical protein n=1 Tax=Streptomyces sp. NPDC005202 TaxID=3157021 RepID=UPI0033AF1293